MFPLPILHDEPPVENVDGDGVRWRRTGSCNRCGECCAGDPFNGTLGPAKVEGMCPLYDEGAKPDGAKEGKCTGREHPYYKNGCASWPHFPAHTADKPSCSYRFERVTG